MTIVFSEQEERYIIKEMFNWHVSDDCPKLIMEKINKKLDAIKKQRENLARIYDNK